jgi:phage FluMu protein Com
MKVRHNDTEKAEDIFCDCRRFLAKVKGGEVYIKCPICKKWHIVKPEKQDSEILRKISN